jgi:hypothetical protein
MAASWKFFSSVIDMHLHTKSSCCLLKQRKTVAMWLFVVVPEQKQRTVVCLLFLDSGDACDKEDSSLQTFVAVKDTTTLHGVLKPFRCETPIGRPTIPGGHWGFRIICKKIRRPPYASHGRRGLCSQLAGCKNWVASLLLSCR